MDGVAFLPLFGKLTKIFKYSSNIYIFKKNAIIVRMIINSCSGLHITAYHFVTFIQDLSLLTRHLENCDFFYYIC